MGTIHPRVYNDVVNHLPSVEGMVKYSLPKHTAVLFAQRGGSYWGEPGLDVYDEQRDAFNYDGKLPVVAHPPCSRWCKMAPVLQAKYPDEKYLVGNDGGTFAFALERVNECGGVLEHPMSSIAWKHYGLRKPSKRGWSRSGKGWVCQVYQSRYGHKAAKGTWLYYCGERKPRPLKWGKKRGTHQISYDSSRGDKNLPSLNSTDASRTPPPFRDLLLSIARGSQSSRAYMASLMRYR